MDKRLFLEQTIEQIRSMDISHIMGKYLRLHRRGNNYLAICPFHNDRNLGSFVVTPSKGIFKCFACGEGGDAIKFLAQLRGLNYVEATFEIALQEGIITSSEYEKYFRKRRYYKKEVENIEKSYTQRDKKKFKPDKAPIAKLNRIYNIFLDCLSLKSEHSQYLQDKRGLPTEIIRVRKYKSSQYPTKRFMERFKEALEQEKESFNSLKKVPGFYQKFSKKHGWYWTFPYYKGIFIPIRNAKGQIEGLQIRRDEKEEHRGRYFWFSSSFAEFAKNHRYGTSSGSPLDVIYPEKKPAKTLFITEGRFKSEIIIQKMNSASISVQGVGNWRNIDKEIIEVEKKVKKQYPCFKGFAYICVAFDSDMSYKYQVYKQLKKMTDYLEKAMPDREIFYLHWNGEYKGIDDLLFNSNYQTPRDCGRLLTSYKKACWDNEYSKQLKTLMHKKDVSHPRELSQSDLKEISITEVKKQG